MNTKLNPITIIAVYLLFISFVGVALTVIDKELAIHEKRRVPESTLMTAGALGGALAMYITMKLIHHKTRKPKFMYGLPIIVLIHIAILLLAFYKFNLI